MGVGPAARAGMDEVARLEAVRRALEVSLDDVLPEIGPELVGQAPDMRRARVVSKKHEIALEKIADTEDDERQ